MKKHALIYIGILLLLLITTTAWRMHPEPVEGSELYQRCKDLPGVRVGFIKDFPLDAEGLYYRFYCPLGSLAWGKR